MTKDEIKKALKTCSVDSCTDCPYDNKGLYCCSKLKRDALNLITEQEKEIEKQNGRVKCLKTRLANKTVLLANVEDLYESETEKLKADNQELATALKQAEDNYSRAFERLKSQQRDIDILKAENEMLSKTREELRNEMWDAQDDLDCYCDEMPNKIKQAKIDVLNELKKYSYTDNFFPDGKWHRYVLVSDIDILIKEVEK